MATQTSPTNSSSTTAESGFDSIHRMNRDWEVLCENRRQAERVASWQVDTEAFAGIADPQQVLDRLAALHRAADWAGHDRVLAALIAMVAGGGADGDLAWRITVRALMPKAILMTKTLMRAGVQWDDVFSTVLSALFEVVATYPLDARPKAIFMNIAMDTLQLTRRIRSRDFDDYTELNRVALELEPFAGDRNGALVPGEMPDPHELVVLAQVLVSATELELVDEDEPALGQHDARTELLSLIVWAVEVKALKVSDAQRIAQYHLSTAEVPGFSPRTRRAMGAEGNRLRQRASRSTGPLRRAASAYLAAA